MPTKVQANRVVEYSINYQASEQAKQRGESENLMQNREQKTYNGHLSQAATKRIKTIVPNLALLAATIQASEKRKRGLKVEHVQKRLELKKPLITFITLTISSPQQHTDNEIKRDCLQPFLASLKRKGRIAHYLWVAETQQNGNIHFHIVTNAYIPKEELRMQWNYYQNLLGYVDRCKFTNPPSTDIQACKSVQNVSRYIAKYLCKNDNKVTDNTANPSKERRKVEGRLWGCDTFTETLTAAIVPEEASEAVYQETTISTTLAIEDQYYSICFIDLAKAPTIIALLLKHWNLIT